MPSGIYKRKTIIYQTQCVICRTKFRIKPYRTKNAKYCSQVCYGISCRGKIPKSAFKLGQRPSPETEYKKGHIPHSKLHPEIMRKGENHYAWKFDKVGYMALHSWVYRQKGRPMVCEHCGATAEDRLLNWANKSWQYKRDLDDWLALCVPCHKKYDGLTK